MAHIPFRLPKGVAQARPFFVGKNFDESKVSRDDRGRFAASASAAIDAHKQKFPSQYQDSVSRPMLDHPDKPQYWVRKALEAARDVLAHKGVKHDGDDRKTLRKAIDAISLLDGNALHLRGMNPHAKELHEAADTKDMMKAASDRHRELLAEVGNAATTHAKAIAEALPFGLSTSAMDPKQVRRGALVTPEMLASPIGGALAALVPKVDHVPLVGGGVIVTPSTDETKKLWRMFDPLFSMGSANDPERVWNALAGAETHAAGGSEGRRQYRKVSQGLWVSADGTASYRYVAEDKLPPNLSPVVQEKGLHMRGVLPWLVRKGHGADDHEHTDEQLELMADILGGLFGDDALKMFTEGAWKKKQWNAAQHPRGANGRFIKRGSDEAATTARERVKDVLKGGKTPDSHKQLVEHLSLLTVKQLHDLKREYNLSASGRVKAELIDVLAERLGKSRTGDAADQAKGEHPTYAEWAKDNREWRTMQEQAKKDRTSSDAPADTRTPSAEDAGGKKVKEPWEMTYREYQTNGEPSYGDMVETHDRKVGYLRGGSSPGRYRVVDKDGKPLGYYGPEQIKLIRRMKDADPGSYGEKSQAESNAPKIRAGFWKEQDDALNALDKEYKDVRFVHSSMRTPEQKVRHEEYQRRKKEILDKPIEFEKTNNLHRSSVESALASGKPVPPEVLADYPDLAEKYGKKKALPWLRVRQRS